MIVRFAEFHTHIVVQNQMAKYSTCLLQNLCDKWALVTNCIQVNALHELTAGLADLMSGRSCVIISAFIIFCRLVSCISVACLSNCRTSKINSSSGCFWSTVMTKNNDLSSKMSGCWLTSAFHAANAFLMIYMRMKNLNLDSTIEKNHKNYQRVNIFTVLHSGLQSGDNNF